MWGGLLTRHTNLGPSTKRVTKMRMRYLSRILAAAALVLAGAGCDDKVKVKGVVTLDGKPIEGAVVTFILESGGGQSASGTTQKDGSFRLTTLKENDGIRPGNYKVTVTKVTYTEVVDTSPARNMKEAMWAHIKANKRKKVHSKNAIPPWYNEASKTVLRQKVPPDSDVQFDLQSK
jgi:hypothetical protein